MATIAIQAGELSGTSGLTLWVYLESTGVLQNTGGDSLSESPASTGRFVASVAETLTGVMYCLVKDSGGYVVRDGYLDDGDTIIQPGYPSSGGTSGNVNVLPYTGAVVDRVTGTKITVFVQEEVSVTIGVTDADGNDVSLTGKTLQFVVEDQYGADVAVIADGSMTKSGNDATITIGTPITGSIAQYHWSLRDITTANVVLAHGVLQVAYAAQEDA